MQNAVQILSKKYKIKSSTDNATAAANADVVVLSVKPQRLSEVMKALIKIRPEALVLSIVAGASIQKISKTLKHQAVVRSMPNTPGQIGEGITVWTASAKTSAEQHEMARQILGALGEEVFVEDESYLDMATALSGTGPAYVFLFTEALIDAGVHMGFPRRIAEQLVLQTIKGSASFYEQAEPPPGDIAQPGDLSGRDIGGGVVLSRKGRLPHRDLKGRVGSVSEIIGVG